MLSIKELESVIEEFNTKQRIIQEQATVAAKEESERQVKFVNDYKDIKNNDIKPNISLLIQSINKAIGIKATVNYTQKDLETVGTFEAIEICITRDDNSSLTIKISPNIYKETIICSVDKNPGFNEDKKFEMALKDFNNNWLNDFVICEFKRFIA